MPMLSDPREPGVSPRDVERTERFAARWRSGVWIGAGVGLAVGVLAGVVIGAIVGGGNRFWMALVACVIAGVGVGTFVGGLSRLESPRPGTEPSEVERPVLDEPELTKREGAEDERA